MNFDNFRFENLDLYKKSINFIDLVYDKTKTFPKDELFGLTNQFRRAANSIALNFAEGYGDSINMNLRYIRIMQGSIRECIVCTTIAYNRNYLNNEDYDVLRNNLTELSKMTSGFKKYLMKKS